MAAVAALAEVHQALQWIGFGNQAHCDSICKEAGFESLEDFVGRSEKDIRVMADRYERRTQAQGRILLQAVGLQLWSNVKLRAVPVSQWHFAFGWELLPHLLMCFFYVLYCGLYIFLQRHEPPFISFDLHCSQLHAQIHIWGLYLVALEFELSL